MAGRALTPAALDESHAALADHYEREGTIPSMAGLARLWGLASKSSASRRVDALLAIDVLVWSTDRRLAPGPAFRFAAPPPATMSSATPPSDARPSEALMESGDVLNAALVAWASDYDPSLARSYSMTTRLLRLARSMEQGFARAAEREGLTSGDVQLLDALYRVGPPHRIAPTALKHYFLMSLAGVAKRVDRLEARGLIARIPNPDDRRGLFIELTAAGHAALTRLVEADRAAPHIVWPLAISESDYRTVLAVLAQAEAEIAAAREC